MITELEETFCEFADVFPTSPTDFVTSSLLPFRVGLPKGSAPFATQSYRIKTNPILATTSGRNLGRVRDNGPDRALYLFVRLALGHRSENVWGHLHHGELQKHLSKFRFRGGYRFLAWMRSLTKLTLAVFSPLSTPRYRYTRRRHDTPITAVFTRAGLFQWLRRPQGCSVFPG